MSTIVTRSGKGSPLTNTEIDANFSNLNNDKLELIVNGITSAATITPASTDTQYNVTALAVDATIAAPSGTPVSGKKLLLRIKDNGTARSLTWNAIFRAIGVTLPTTTVAGKYLYAGLEYNATDTKWDVLAIRQEA
jgi:hypothetical protein